jgi:hypothetical protein
MSLQKKAIYFIGSDLRVSKESLENVSKISSFDKVYQAFSCGVLPSDGYVAEFNVEGEVEIVNLNRELSKIKGIEPRLIFAGIMVGPVVKESGKKNEK